MRLPMRQATSTGKVALAVLSILLTCLIWWKGLQDSFDRPSVVPKLSLRQQEISLLARPSVPESLKPFFIGESPKAKLKQELSELSFDQMEERERLILASLDSDLENRRSVLEIPFKNKEWESIQKALLASSPESIDSPSISYALEGVRNDPLLYQVTCSALVQSGDICIDLNISRGMAMRLFFSQGMPALAILIGSCLLIRQIWLLLKKKNSPWPEIIAAPFSILDLVLLVAGGFVVLGEVLFPALIAPITTSLTGEISSPLRESVRVFIGYISMTVPPLIILRQLINRLTTLPRPDGGWLQWRLRPLNQAFLNASGGWLMVMPLVLLASWIANSLVGDQGGSNPLLELVLRSQEPLAVTLLLITTVVFAPLFEELIFRGALLPVLAKALGRSWGIVVSALVFALAHLSVGEFPPLVVLGLGLAFLRLSSGRLFPCVLMHSLWNGITFVNLLLLA